MSAANSSRPSIASRFAFIETLSGEFLSKTGRGVYVFLSPFDVERLFELYCGSDMPILTYARQCVKKTVA